MILILLGILRKLILVKADLDLEFSILSTLMSPKSSNELKHELMARLTPNHFSSQVTIESFSRCASLLKLKGFIPTLRDIAVDPGVSKQTRKIIKNSKNKPFKSEEDMLSGLSTIESLRKVRALNYLGAKLQEALEEKSFDLEATITELNNNMSTVVEGVEDSIITHIGVDGNAIPMVKKILDGNAIRRIPTGIKAYDSVNVGIPFGSVFLLGATTSGGKSTLVNNLEENFAENGARVGSVPLEMETSENLQRNLSRISNVPLLDFLRVESMSKNKKKGILKKFREYNKRLKKRGGRITYIEPKFAPTMEKLLYYVKPMELDVIMIDYIGLLEGVGGNDQWLALSNAVAFAKRWATDNKAIVVIAAQLSDEGVIRYSRAMREHASHMWTWIFTEEARETGIVEIKQEKCRQGKMFPFLLKFDFDKMIVRDVTKKEKEKHAESSRKTGKAKWKSKQSTNSDYSYDNSDYSDTNDGKQKVKGKKKRSKPKKAKYDDNENRYTY